MGIVISNVNATSEAIVDVTASAAPAELDAIFRAQFPRIARVIARVVRDPARAEDLAVEVFLKLWRNPQAQRENPGGWLYRAAVNAGLDELRRQTRRIRYESLFRFVRALPNPEEIHAANEEQQRVRSVLAGIDRRHAELLLLHGQGLSYQELATVLGLKFTSVGTLLSRAQQAFRKEFLKRFGDEHGK